MSNRILFIGYWNLDDGLTHSTIFLHLKILKEIPNVEYLHFVNTQREKPTKNSLDKIKFLGVDYSPLYSKNLPFNFLNKIYDFIHFPKLIKELCLKHNINLIISRGAPAGSLAYLATKENKIPFIVESFEPHADYMKAAGEWKSYGLKYLFQKYWEKQQKKYSKAIITVAENYRSRLIVEGILKDKIFVVPCAVDQNIFFKDKNLGEEMKLKLKIPYEATVGVYAGKFGGLYLKQEAFQIFKEAFNQIKDFHLLLLTNTDSSWLNEMIQQYRLPSNRIHFKFVPYNEVNNYLNIADFAFALYKSNHVSQFLSPVKIGEYWACGLPVLITPNLGDEMHWIEEEELGFIKEKKDSNYFKKFTDFSVSNIINKGKSLRGMAKVSQVYNQILN
ncbi:glycosyltransferase [Marivirga salinae]|uniref:Glycosyltransferase n=1 Tax=Marivirga salinarum TaxID=3059078 RepID=A0AA51RBG0_9BACT|nr:glycosyltransferase [Marivirga sp. BDSF4-3]WMN12181.1 glycosyltransferase [Marivirga sp. BDSF4-3]